MKLLGKRYLVKKDKPEYDGNILLLENMDMHPFTGEIVLIGNQIKTDEYNIGDRIIFSDIGYDVTDIMEIYDKENMYVFVNEDSVLGKFLQ